MGGGVRGEDIFPASDVHPAKPQETDPILEVPVAKVISEAEPVIAESLRDTLFGFWPGSWCVKDILGKIPCELPAQVMVGITVGCEAQVASVLPQRQPRRRRGYGLRPEGLGLL